VIWVVLLWRVFLPLPTGFSGGWFCGGAAGESFGVDGAVMVWIGWWIILDSDLVLVLA
jgi:hypothetical protein